MKLLFPVILAAVLASSTLAAERASYETVRAHWASSVEHRRVWVTTLDGSKHDAKRVELWGGHITIHGRDDRTEDIPEDEIARIEISKSKHHWIQIVYGAVIPFVIGYGICDGDKSVLREICIVPCSLLFSPVWAYVAASAPVWLGWDAIDVFLPAKAYDIIH